MTDCAHCGARIGLNPSQGQLWAHAKQCRKSGAAEARQKAKSRALGDITNLRTGQKTAYDGCGGLPATYPTRAVVNNDGREDGVAPHAHSHEFEQGPPTQAEPLHDVQHQAAIDDAGVHTPCLFNQCADAGDEAVDTPNDEERGPDGIPDGLQHQIGDDTQPAIKIEQHLSYDAVLAWAIHDLTTVQRERFFLAMRLLPVLRGTGPEYNPVHHSSLQTCHAFEAYMDKQVIEMECGLKLVQVKIQSDVPALRQLPPVSLLMRPLKDVLTCAFGSSSLNPGTFSLEPEKPDCVYGDINCGRVNHHTQSQFMRKAKHVCLSQIVHLASTLRG